jgi:hypothetical protein
MQAAKCKKTSPLDESLNSGARSLPFQLAEISMKTKQKATKEICTEGREELKELIDVDPCPFQAGKTKHRRPRRARRMEILGPPRFCPNPFETFAIFCVVDVDPCRFQAPQSRGKQNTEGHSAAKPQPHGMLCRRIELCDSLDCGALIE